MSRFCLPFLFAILAAGVGVPFCISLENASSAASAEETPTAPPESHITPFAKALRECQASAPSLAPRLRRPVAMAFVDNGKQLVVANRGSDTVSVIDTEKNCLITEHSVGERLSDIVTCDNDRYLLATDEARHRLLLLAREGSGLTVAAQLEIAPYPVSVRLSGDGRSCFVASLWSRRLTVVSLDFKTDQKATPTLSVERSIPLPFAPRMQLWIPRGQRLLVADSFGGNVAIVDPKEGTIESVRSLPAHNIRGLAIHPKTDEVLVSHQTLSRLARTTFEDLHWGTLMTNVAHALAINAVLDPQADLLTGSRTLRLGDVGRAAGDPAGIAVTADRKIVVAYSGIDEVAVLEEGRPGQQRLEVGKRPTAVAIHPNRNSTAYIADTLGDTITVIDFPANEPRASVAAISLGPQPALTPADQGELLFHNARLSHDGWMSCQSCHTDGHSNGLLNDNQGDGSFDAPKRVLSLLGVADTEPLAWNGGSPDLAGQIRKSVSTTMHGPGFAGDLTDEHVAALSAYLRTLNPAPALGPLTGNASPQAIERGQKIFERLDCRRCHAPPTYTSPAAYDVGLEDEVGNTKFNPPSLRGVSQRDALFHDNRARSLDDVFAKHRHQVPADLSDRDRADLIEFLRSL